MAESASGTGLPAPIDDGAAEALPGKPVPALVLPSTDGCPVRMNELAARSVVFVYPSIGGPGAEDLLDRWTATPGARGCTPEACSFRDELAGFRAAGVDVFGLSSQSNAIQGEHVRQLGLPYPLLSDETMQLADLLGLPTFEFDGRRYFKRLTLVLAQDVVESALYPVFPPEHAAIQALESITDHRPGR